MEISVGSQGFEDEIRKNEGNVWCCMKEWKRKVSSPAVYVRRKSPINHFCAIIARSGSISDAVV